MKRFEKIIKNYEYVFFGILTLLLLLKFFLINRFNNTDFIFSYNFFTDDSYDWIANGVQFGSDVISYRNPGLPLKIWFLDKVNLLFLLPLTNQIVLLFFFVFIYLIVKRITKSRFISVLIVSFTFLNTYLQIFSNYILADLYAVTALTAAIYFVLRKNNYLAALSIAVSMLFQNFGYFIYIIFAFYCFIDLGVSLFLRGFNRKQFFETSLKTALVMFPPLIPIAIWHLYKLIKFGDPLYTKIIQFQLLNFDLDSLFFYLVGAIAIFGLGFLIMFKGLFDLRFKVNLNQYFYIISTFFLTFFFWILLYDWNDRRFLLYLLPFMLIGASIFLVKLKKVSRIIVFSVIMFYPTFFGIGLNLSQTNLPLLHNYGIEFKSEINESGVIKIKYDASFVKKENWNLKTILPSVLTEFITNRKILQDRNNYAIINHYKLLEDYNSDSNSFCFISKESYSPYILNSILTIEFNKAFFIDFEGNTLKTDDCF